MIEPKGGEREVPDDAAWLTERREVSVILDEIR